MHTLLHYSRNPGSVGLFPCRKRSTRISFDDFLRRDDDRDLFSSWTGTQKVDLSLANDQENYFSGEDPELGADGGFLAVFSLTVSLQ